MILLTMADVDKKALRKEMRAVLSALGQESVKERSALICNELRGRILSCECRVVALFAPFGHEPDIWPLVEELSMKMNVLLPKVEGDVMQFYRYGGSALCHGAFGILEPVAGIPVSPSDIDVVVVPGVAFTKGGARMGRGKGYYDKYLSREGFRGLKIGVCFSEQIVGRLPSEAHDVMMDAVISK